jgi:hypothetical protein
VLIFIAGSTVTFNAKYSYQLMEEKHMNTTTTHIKHDGTVDNKKINLGRKGCEICTPSFMSKLMTNMSNKLGLSLAIYQK